MANRTVAASISSLNMSIILHREVLQLRPSPHPHRSESLIQLADALNARFDQTRSKLDLDEAITLYHEVLNLLYPCSSSQRFLCTPPTMPLPDRPSITMNNLAILLGRRFKQTGEILDLEGAISFHQQSLELLPALHPYRSMLLNHLASALQTRCEWVGQLSDLEGAILFHGQALELRPAPHPHRSKSLNNLANALKTRFNQTGQLSDLEEAISFHRQALELCPAPHPDRSRSLDSLASALSIRFEQMGQLGDLEKANSLHVRHSSCFLFNQTGQLSDLEEAISIHRQALELCPAPHPDRPRSLNNLAITLSARFEQTGRLGDLEEAISFHGQALELLPEPHPHRSTSLNNLAFALQTQFEQTGQLSDLQDAILFHRQALELRLAPHPDRSMSLNNLAGALQTRFKQTGQPCDLEVAISFLQQALDLRPAPHPYRSSSLNNLANALLARFEQTGQLGDLEEAISFLRQALDLHPAPHPHRSTSLNNLAGALWTRFEQTGQLGHLEEAISFLWQALELYPALHPHRSGSLNNLANALFARFGQTGQLGDLEEAVAFDRMALELCPASHPHRSMSLNNLASALWTRFEQTGQLGDLEEAISFLQQALDLCPAPHPYRSSSLNNLANALLARFEQTGQLGDLEEAISFLRQALDLHPAPHPHRSTSLNNLAIALKTRFEQMGQLGDLEEAISFHRQALDLLPLDHPHQCMFNSHFGLELLALYHHTHQQRHLDDAVIAFRASVACTSASTLVRFVAARRWALRTDGNHDSALEAYRAAIQLLPRIAMLGLNLQSRQEALISRSDGLARDAAACAIRSGDFKKAIELLEEGRAIFWSQALQLRTPLDDLRARKPALAQKLENISRALEQGSQRDTFRSPSDSAQKVLSMEQEASHYRKLNDEWLAVLQEIRMLDGFHNFLLPKSFDILHGAASRGPVVIVNASRSRCDALVLTSSTVKHVPLDLTIVDALILVHCKRHAASSSPLPQGLQKFLEKVVGKTRDLMTEEQRHLRPKRIDVKRQRHPDETFQDILRTLWKCVVEPILHSLDLKKSESPPRLWWCPTGPFTFLPLHAAGIYSGRGDGEDMVSQYVVSSCTHTLNALFPPLPQPAKPFKILAAIHSPPDGSSLPCVGDELKMIEKHVPSDLLVKLGIPEAPSLVRDVLSHIPSASIVHFACHGTQNAQNPLESSLRMEDGPLKVSHIMKQSMPNALLAFLSACQTAMGDDKVPDEAMHLAATLLFAGFRGTVATMWNIYDTDGPYIVDSFYEYLFQDESGTRVSSPDTARAARALHVAVSNLRKRHVPFARWVPFVHFGW
ncbi:hypothetical protein EW146_g7830 [Bondarzewia mesenterica]|uniref:CHAT domain-containing protein n=1 Tax=Bondarzewia mesenterica TaxID=1095465 RepID=A0A4S4LJ38_9AGAM|nr:hypothetical protein EW146_g7830 [Bondarzewia mesenterica]